MLAYNLNPIRAYTEWLADQLDLDTEDITTMENNDTEDDKEQSLEETLGKRSASTSTLSDFNESLNIDKLVEAVEAYRHAVGEHRGHPVSADLSYVGDGEEVEWKVSITVKREISQSDRDTNIELMEHSNQGAEMIASSVTKSHSVTVENTVEAYKIFEDTCEEYGLTEITDPEMPESEMLNPPEDKDDTED